MHFANLPSRNGECATQTGCGECSCRLYLVYLRILEFGEIDYIGKVGSIRRKVGLLGLGKGHFIQVHLEVTPLAEGVGATR